jgi:predicted porin
MAWYLGAKFRTGNHELRARFSQALEPNCTLADGSDCPDAVTDERGAQQYALGYAYHLAKSTQIYAFYTQIMNDDAAQYTFSVGGPQTGSGSTDYLFAATPAGADPLAVGVGMRYAF